MLFFTAAVLKESIYLQGCKHTLCLGGICLGNWEKWRALLLVPSPTFHIDPQASLQNCFLLKYRQHNKKKRKEKWGIKALEETIFREERRMWLWRWRLPAVSFLVAPDNPSMRRLATTVRTERQMHVWFLSFYLSLCYCLCSVQSLISAKRRVESAKNKTSRFWISPTVKQHYANAKLCWL